MIISYSRLPITKCFVFLITLIAAFYSNASSDNKIIENTKDRTVIFVKGTYTLGDIDSLYNAKKYLSDQLKIEASEIFGVHVQHELVIDNQKITKDKLSTYSYSYMQFNKLSESPKYINGKMTIEISAHATFDKSHISNHLDNLEGLNKLSEISNENEKLKLQLKELNTLAQSGTLNQQKDTRKDLINKIEHNSKAFVQIIDSRKLEEQINDIEQGFEAEIKRLNKGMLNIFKNHTTLKVNQPQIIETLKDKVTVAIKIDYEIDRGQLTELFGRYFDSKETNKAYISQYAHLSHLGYIFGRRPSGSGRSIVFDNLHEDIMKQSYFKSFWPHLYSQASIKFKYPNLSEILILPVKLTPSAKELFQLFHMGFYESMRSGGMSTEYKTRLIINYKSTETLKLKLFKEDLSSLEDLKISYDITPVELPLGYR
ncbi:hypothetical protein [Algibacillus agarilyticus]|uniref:hypothetical protein n=1 Tax=Algibacillus agarilyticus TaxID=2234133 RepID=UPI000DCF79DD|nr:hypothetical protein [Algibacillus agarilyticus]